MAGYMKGSQAWYDESRRRLVEISKKLKSPETNRDDKEKLYDEQCCLIDELLEYGNENLVNTPIV